MRMLSVLSLLQRGFLHERVPYSIVFAACLCGVLLASLLQMVDESALLDLKHLLMEAQQRVPPVLMALEDPDQEMDEVCGRLRGWLNHLVRSWTCFVV